MTKTNLNTALRVQTVTDSRDGQKGRTDPGTDTALRENTEAEGIQGVRISRPTVNTFPCIFGN